MNPCVLSHVGWFRNSLCVETFDLPGAWRKELRKTVPTKATDNKIASSVSSLTVLRSIEVKNMRSQSSGSETFDWCFSMGVKLRTCVRECVRVCVYAYVRVCIRMRDRMFLWLIENFGTSTSRHHTR